MGAGETCKPSSDNEQPPANCTVCYKVQVALRSLLFAATLTSVVVMVTGHQTELVPVPGATLLLPVPAKFNHSPAFIYFVAALLAACFYSITTTFAFLSAILKSCYSSKFLLFNGLLDVLMLGTLASATGAGGSVAYIGLKGNSHAGWGKVCNIYDKFCRHVASSLAVSLFASFLLLLISMASIKSLHKRIR